MIAIPEPPIVSARVGLRLLRNDLNRSILEALGPGPVSAGELCTRLMLESDTSLREQLRELEAIGAIEEWSGSLGRAKEFRLSPVGEDLARVIATVRGGLARRPGAALSPESDAAWRALAALGDGWELSLIQHILVRPSTQRELMATIPALNKQKAQRMLRRLVGAGLVTVPDPDRRPSHYAASEWARRAMGVLSAFARWERRHLSEIARPVAATEAAIGLLAILPLVHRPHEVTGVCSFTLEAAGRGATPRSSAVWARVAEGRVSVCRVGRCPIGLDAWAHGDIDDWIRALIIGRPGSLRLGGDRRLAISVLQGLHEEFTADRESTKS